MALDFPSSPSLNDIYQIGNKTWKWNGEAWQLQGEFYNVGGIYDHANGAFDLANGTATVANTDVTNVSVNSGTYGNTTAIPSLTIAANGRITAVTTVSSELINDTTPQLGGNLDLNGNDITGTGDIDISGDVTVVGNLIVTGETTYANTTTVNLGDNIITLNADIPQDSAPSENAGIEIDRGTSDNVALLWNETDDEWTFTNDGSTYSPIASADRLDSAYTQANASYTHAEAAFSAANTLSLGAITVSSFSTTANGLVDTFDLGFTPQSNDSVWVSVGGVTQVAGDGYFVNTSTDTITFTSTPDNGESIYVVSMFTNAQTYSQFESTAAYAHANGAFDAANTNASSITNTNNRLDNAYFHANSAYNVANTAITTSGGTITGNLTVTQNLSVANISLTGTANVPSLITSDTLTVGTQVFYTQGANGFSVNEDFDPSANSTQTAYHFTSGAGRETVAFTLARTAQFTDGFGIYGTSSDNKFVMFGEQNNTSWEWRKGVGIQPLDLDGGTLVANLSSTGNLTTLGTISAPGFFDDGVDVKGHAEAAFTKANTNATNITTAQNTADGAYAHANGAFDLANGTASIANTDVTQVSITADTYGNSTAIPSLTLAANGRVTAITTTSISIPETYNDANVVSLLSSFGSNTITTTGDISVGNVTTTGTINIASAFEFPVTDGSADQVLVTDGAGTLTWTDQSGGGIANAIVEVFTTTANGATASFDLGFEPSGGLAILATIDGVSQANSTNYTISGSTITFTSTPDNGSVIYVTGFTNVTPIGPASVTVTSFATTSNGSVASYDLGFTTVNEESLIVSLDGVLQQPSSAYTVSGNTITFSENPANSVNVVVTSMYTNVVTYSTSTLSSAYDHANAAYDQANTSTITASDYSSNFYTANGTGTTFDVTSGHNANSVMVYYNGLMLAPAVDYDISETTLTMTFTPTANSDILIRYMPI